MKNLKLSIFSIFMVLFIFTSCTNDDSIVDLPQNMQESETITTVMGLMSQLYDQNGNLNSDNDFEICFDFVYPLELMFNNGTTVTVNSEEELIDVMMNSTEELYITGIVFPFDVELYNETTDTVEIVTINNEEEFAALLESCDIGDGDGNGDGDGDGDGNGDIVIDCSIEDITNVLAAYCWVIDFIDFNEFIYTLNIDGTYQIEDIGGSTGGSILTTGTWSVTPENDTFYITLNADDAVYNDQWIVTQCDVNNQNISLESLVYPQADIYIVECQDDGEIIINCLIEDITNKLLDCFWQIDFVDDDQYLYNLNSDGTYQVQSDDSLLTSGTWSIAPANDTFYIILNANISQYSDEWVVTGCDQSNGDLQVQSLVYPQAELYSIDCISGGDFDCTIEEVSSFLNDCLWVIDFIDFNEFIYNFNSDGTYVVESENNILTTGTWVINPVNGVYIITLNAEDAVYNDTWLIIECNEDGLLIVSVEYPQAQVFSTNCG
jgi:hypothetical protein